MEKCCQCININFGKVRPSEPKTLCRGGHCWFSFRQIEKFTRFRRPCNLFFFFQVIASIGRLYTGFLHQRPRFNPKVRVVFSMGRSGTVTVFFFYKTASPHPSYSTSASYTLLSSLIKSTLRSSQYIIIILVLSWEITSGPTLGWDQNLWSLKNVRCLFVVYLMTLLFSDSGYIASNEWVISELWTWKDMEGTGCGLIFRYYPNTFLEGLRNTMKNPQLR